MTKKVPKREPNSAIVRVHKNKNFTVMSNRHLLYEKPPMSLKAKGLLSMFLALPPEWNYSINGIASICKESRDCIRSTIAELTAHGYLRIEKQNGENGRFIYIYNIFDEPQNLCSPDMENPHLENPTQEVPKLDDPVPENPTQLNIKEINTNELSTEELSTKKGKRKNVKKPYGEFKNVFLTEEHIEKLQNIYKTEKNFNKAVEILSSYKQANGKSYKNDYAVLNEFNWVYEKVFSKNNSISKFSAENLAKLIDTPDYESASRW